MEPSTSKNRKFFENNESKLFNYRIFVFGLISNLRLDDHPDLKSLLRSRKVIISEHPVEDEPTCEYNCLHYHGIVELDKKIRFDNDRKFNEIRKQCHFFKSETCRLPVNFMAYLQLPPRQIIFKNYWGNSQLMDKFNAVMPQLIESIRQRRLTQISKMNPTATAEDIQIIMKMIRKQRAQSESQLMPLYDDPEFLTVYTKRTFSLNFKKALEVEKQACLDRPLLTLVSEYSDFKKECLSPQLSAEIMEEWCAFQNIQPRNFLLHVIEFMDRTKKKRNTLYLNGEPNSGKTFIAQSLERASFFYRTVTQVTSSYQFMWQDCLNKRLIIINEPYFDTGMIEQLKIILEGSGTFVHKKMTGDEYLRPTPVLMTSNSYVWNNSMGSKKAIVARCVHFYDNLKACPFLEKYNLALHPKWMEIFAARYLTDNEKFQFSAVKADEKPPLKQLMETATPVEISDFSDEEPPQKRNKKEKEEPQRKKPIEIITLSDSEEPPQKKIKKEKEEPQRKKPIEIITLSDSEEPPKKSIKKEKEEPQIKQPVEVMDLSKKEEPEQKTKEEPNTEQEELSEYEEMEEFGQLDDFDSWFTQDF